MGGGRRAALGCGAVAIGLLGTATARAEPACSNAQLRAEDGSTALPDCRAWELVSPAQKNGGAIAAPGAILGGGVSQAAADGSSATFGSAASFGQAQGAPPASQYLARRGVTGWQTRNIAPPTLSGAYEGSAGVPYQLFSPDLARALMAEGRRCGVGEECPRTYSLRSGEGSALAVSPSEADLSFAGASPDLRQVILATCTALTPEAVEAPAGGGGCDPTEPNLYQWEWDEGALHLINILPGQSEGTPGAALAAQGAGAVSTDGSRVYFTDQGNLYLREGSITRQLDEEAGGGGTFQAASADGSIAFFTKAGHLYRYQVHAEDPPFAIDLTPSGGVKGVLGTSEAGSRVYYQDTVGLQLWDEGATTEIAPGAEAAQPSDWPPTTGTARVSPNGSHLAFASKAPLTGYDNTDQQTGEADTELYLYDAETDELACASCNPTGEAPQGPSSIPGAIANGEGPSATDTYKPRDLSVNGNRLFFDSRDALVANDANNAQDVYQWEAGGEGSCSQAAGCLSLISAARGGEASSFIDASADGSDAFFLTAQSLVPSDPGSVDLYDARVGGGFPLPEVPTPCEGDACQSVPSAPEDPSPATLVPGGGNPATVGFPNRRCPRGKRAVVRHGARTCADKRSKRHKRGRR